MKIYYLPGHGGSISNGLGQALSGRGYDVFGRETVGDFRRLDFNDQVDTIAQDLIRDFWSKDSRIVANSFGAYLLLHALAKLEPYKGNIILLSPIVGEFKSDEIRMGFIPPYSKRLFELANANQFPVPKHCSFHVGSEDWQSNPKNVSTFAELLGAPVTIVPHVGHQLPRNYVNQLLDSVFSPNSNEC